MQSFDGGLPHEHDDLQSSNAIGQEDEAGFIFSERNSVL